jgi:mono/diheme cytochrome c family protein
VLSFIGLGTLIAVATLLAWSGIRAYGTKNRLLKWSGVGLAAVLAMAAWGASVLTIAGLLELRGRRALVPDLRVTSSAERIRRGEGLANSFCGACHSATGPLTGGSDLGKDFPLPIGSFVASNLTAAGELSRWSDGEIFRAIRNGVDRDGRWLIVMSYTNAGNLSDEDTKALIAYIRRQPAAGTATASPPDRLNLLGLIMLGAGMLPTGKPTFAGAISSPPKGPTARYGEYILSYQNCWLCHGDNLTGGVPGQLGPIGPDLNLVRNWKVEQFIATLRTGTDPGGHQLTDQMPWKFTAKMDDEELTAVYEYLTRLPAPYTTAM